jgi:hypothetical protein
MTPPVPACCHAPPANAQCLSASGSSAGSRLNNQNVFSVTRILRGCQWGCSVLLGSLLTLCATAASQDPNIDRSPAPDTAATAAISQLRLSDELAYFGERNADPIALVEAAKIRKMLPPPLNGSNEEPSDHAWTALLARAAQLAGPNPMVSSFIDDVRHLRVRDIPVIPLNIKVVHKQIKGNAADRAEVRFLAGELAVVYVHPVNGAGLDFFVYDDLNNLICSGGGGAQGSECRWRPRRDGSYLIDVRNDNSADVDYELAINREIVPR